MKKGPLSMRGPFRSFSQRVRMVLVLLSDRQLRWMQPVLSKKTPLSDDCMLHIVHQAIRQGCYFA